MPTTTTTLTLTRDEILRKTELPSVEVKVPEWGGTVRVRALTAGERDAYELRMRDARQDGDAPNIRAALAVLTLVDGEGKPLFAEHDAATLAVYHAKPLDRVFNAAARLSGITPDDVDALEKN
jgi:hypothetical protein